MSEQELASPCELEEGKTEDDFQASEDAARTASDGFTATKEPL